MARLTKSTVGKARPQDRPYFVWSTDPNGFGVRVFPSGRKVYYVDYRTAAGIRRRMRIGTHGDLTPEQAVAKAKKTLGAVAAQNRDPLQDRREARAAITVAELCDRYLGAAERGLILGKGGTAKKPGTLAIDRGRISRHLVPLLGHRRLPDLRQSDIEKAMRAIIAGETAVVEKTGNLRGVARVSGGPATAARAIGLLGGILSFAVSEGLIESNPARGVKKPSSRQRDRRLSLGEYRALHRTLQTLEDAGSVPKVAAAMLRFAALSGLRIGEVETLRWGAIDLENGVISLLDSKTGPSRRPVGERALGVLGAPDGAADGYIFPGPRSGRNFGGIKRIYRKVFAAAKLPGVTPHVLRHSFASVGADLGYSDPTIGACLGHAGRGITSRYTHRLDTALVAAADAIAAEVWRQMTS